MGEYTILVFTNTETIQHGLIWSRNDDDGGDCDDGDPGETTNQMSFIPGRGPPPSQGTQTIARLTTDDDIAHFLITFARMARVYRWPKMGGLCILFLCSRAKHAVLMF